MTLRYVASNDPVFARRVARMIPHCDAAGFPTAVATIAVDSISADDPPCTIAGLVYYNHNRAAGTIDIAAAALPKVHWLTRRTAQYVFDHAFEHFGCQMVVMRTSMDNKPLWSRLAGFGFDLAYVSRLYGRNQGGVVCTFTDDKWAKHPLNRRRHPQQEAA